MSTPIKELAAWLLGATQHHISLRDLTNTLVHKLREAGIPLSRVNLGVFALHPEMAGYAVSWAEGMEEPMEFPVTREDMLTPTYLNSPIKVLVDQQQSLHFNLENPKDVEKYSVLSDFHENGNTDYRGFPISYGEKGVAALTLCTNRPGGFTTSEISDIQELFPILGLLIDLVETRRLSQTVLRTYLGRSTSRRVLQGKIQRGQGEHIKAALWLCFLRKFSVLTDRLEPKVLINLMNRYFDCMAEAVWENGGEILKFMGDAMLAVFRISDQRGALEASVQAVQAGHDAQSRLAVLSQKCVEEGIGPLHVEVAVHLGDVVYGNIGARTRLDFTVMGSNVNLLARLQTLTAKLEEPVLVTAEIAAQLDSPTESIGEHQFKGIEHPLEIFRPAKAALASAR